MANHLHSNLLAPVEEEEAVEVSKGSNRILDPLEDLLRDKVKL